jgi:hypothetical protein
MKGKEREENKGLSSRNNIKEIPSYKGNERLTMMFGALFPTAIESLQ